MSAESRDAFWDGLIHNVNSRCASLKQAATLLRKSSPEDSRELVSLMVQQARNLADEIKDAAVRLSIERK